MHTFAFTLVKSVGEPSEKELRKKSKILQVSVPFTAVRTSFVSLQSPAKDSYLTSALSIFDWSMAEATVAR